METNSAICTGAGRCQQQNYASPCHAIDAVVSEQTIPTVWWMSVEMRVCIQCTQSKRIIDANKPNVCLNNGKKLINKLYFWSFVMMPQLNGNKKGEDQTNGGNQKLKTKQQTEKKRERKNEKKKPGTKHWYLFAVEFPVDMRIFFALFHFWHTFIYLYTVRNEFVIACQTCGIFISAKENSANSSTKSAVIICSFFADVAHHNNCCCQCLVFL